jgi:hypothetical protein
LPRCVPCELHRLTVCRLCAASIGSTTCRPPTGRTRTRHSASDGLCWLVMVLTPFSPPQIHRVQCNNHCTPHARARLREPPPTH